MHTNIRQTYIHTLEKFNIDDDPQINTQREGHLHFLKLPTFSHCLKMGPGYKA